MEWHVKLHLNEPTVKHFYTVAMWLCLIILEITYNVFYAPKFSSIKAWNEENWRSANYEKSIWFGQSQKKWYFFSQHKKLQKNRQIILKKLISEVLSSSYLIFQLSLIKTYRLKLVLLWLDLLDMIIKVTSKKMFANIYKMCRYPQ